MQSSIFTFRKKQLTAIAFCISAILLGLNHSAPAAHPWFSGRTIAGQTRPLTRGIAAPTSSATVSNGLIDLVISLYNDPKGDDNGNTQGDDDDSIEQDKYEHIIQFFADAVYEASEGQHAIRKVRLYRNSQQQNAADVYWAARSGHPATVGCLNTNGRPSLLYMYDVSGSRNFTNYADIEVGGYTLAHEWGHYCYGLKDEYCRWVNTNFVYLADSECPRPAIMNEQWPAEYRNYAWLNHSIRWKGGPPYADYENTRTTVQHQVYGASCWETLARNVTNDPLHSPLTMKLRRQDGRRISYPELQPQAPQGTNVPRIDLSPSGDPSSLPSRANLNIIWMSTNLVVEFVIQHSTGMAPYLDKVKKAAQYVVDTLPDGSAVGILTYDTQFTEHYPITIIQSPAQRAAVTNAINTITISADSMKNDGEALDWAWGYLQNFGHTNWTRTVFFMTTDPCTSETGPPAYYVHNYYRNGQVAIWILSYWSLIGCEDPRIELLSLAWETGGQYFDYPDSLRDVASAFRDACAVTVARKLLLSGSSRPGGSISGRTVSSFNISLPVDSSLSDLSVSVSHPTTNVVVARLTAPDGTQYSASSTNYDDGDRLLTFSLNTPAAGTWQITGQASAGTVLRYRAEGSPRDNTYYLEASAAGQDTVRYPSPLEITATLLKSGKRVQNAGATATITDSSGNSSSITLANDEPGFYYACPLLNNGIYQVVVQVNNNSGGAFLTSLGNTVSPDENGNIPLEPDQPVAENFSRAVSFTVAVTNVPVGLPAPAAPAGLTASDGIYGNEVLLAWNATADTQVYEIWRHTTADPTGAAKISEVAYTDNQYSDESVAADVIYYYWIKAKNISGSSDFSNNDSGWLLAPPANASAGQGTYSCAVPLSWTGRDDADSYVIYRGTYNDQRSSVEIAGTTSTSYSDSTAAYRTNYYYWVMISKNDNLSRAAEPAMGYTQYPVSPVADFDSDRKCDPAVYNEATGAWGIRFSAGGYGLMTTTLGGLGYVGLAADFDGDGKADPALYKTATGDWTIMLSSAGYGTLSFEALLGRSGYTPLASDFDGDRLADPTVYAEATASWKILLSSSGYALLDLPQLLGGNGYEPLAADFDGDGKADPAAYQWTTGTWLIRLSTTGYSTITLPQLMGGAGWFQACGDYDNDGLADPAVYNPAASQWHFKLSGYAYTDLLTSLTF